MIFFAVLTVMSSALCFVAIAQGDGGYHEIKCEGETMNISCSKNATINIIESEYGQQFSGYSCVGEEDNSRHGRLPCLSTRALGVVEHRCKNKTECQIHVSRKTFDDPLCHNATDVYLKVHFSCIPLYPSTVVPTPSNPPVVDPRIQTCEPCVGCVKCWRCMRKNITWPETPAGTWANASCPNDPTSMNARLFCKSDPVEWDSRPDLSDCVSQKVTNLHQRVRKTKDFKVLAPAAMELASVVQSSEPATAGDVAGVAAAMREVVNVLDTVDATADEEAKACVHHVSKAVLTMTDGILDDKQSSTWADIPEQEWGSVASQMMTTVEASAFQVAETLVTPQKVINITKQLILEVSVIEIGNSDAAEDAVFPSPDALKGSDWESSTNSLRLPKESLISLFPSGRAKVVFSTYNNLENLLIPSAAESPSVNSMSSEAESIFCSKFSHSIANCTQIVNTKVISASVRSRRVIGLETKLEKPVVFTLEHKMTENVSNPECVFWKFANKGDKISGSWSKDGCELLESTLTHTTCSCQHLTSFAVIMSPTSPQVSEANALALDIITYIGCSVSILCLLLSFLTFSYFRSLQCDRNTIHKNLVLCMMIANLIFLIGIDMVYYEIACYVFSGFLHYFLLAVFSWMCIEGVQLYYMLIEVFEADRSHVLWFYLSGYGFPALIVTISAAVYPTGYKTDHYCWLTTDKGFIAAFIAPAGAVILVNSVMLGIALRAMYLHTSNAATWRMKEKTKLQQFRSWTKGSVVLISLLGLTWAFGFLYVGDGTIAFAYIFTILNSFQGLFIFIFHCLMNDKVQKEYKRCVKNATWLPERFRVWYVGPRASYTVTPNQTSSSTGGGGAGGVFTRLFSRQRRSSLNTSVSHLASSQRRQSSLRQEAEKAREEVVAVAPDSGIDDPSSSYRDNSEIHIGESEFNTMGLSSNMEGSVADTDYCEKVIPKPRKTKLSDQSKRGSSHSSAIVEELEPLNSQDTGFESKFQPSLEEEEDSTIQSSEGRTSSQNLDSSKSREPGRSKRKSSRKEHDSLNGSEKPVKDEVNRFSCPDESLVQHDMNKEVARKSSGAKPRGSGVRVSTSMPKSTGV